MIIRGFSVCSQVCSHSSVKSVVLHHSANWRHFSAAVNINNLEKKLSRSDCIDGTFKLTHKKCVLQILKIHGSPRHFKTCSRLYDEVKVNNDGDETVDEESSSSINQQKGTANNKNTTNVVNLKNFEFTEFIPFFKTSKHTMLLLVLILKLRLVNAILMLSYVSTRIYSANAGTLNAVDTNSGIALLSGLAILTLLSIPCTQLVGNMSVDKDFRILRIQHLDGLGRKKSAYFDPDDFVHIMDLPHLNAFRRKSTYYPVKTYSFVNDQKFNTSHIFGKILDIDIFTRVFGPIKFR